MWNIRFELDGDEESLLRDLLACDEFYGDTPKRALVKLLKLRRSSTRVVEMPLLDKKLARKMAIERELIEMGETPAAASKEKDIKKPWDETGFNDATKALIGDDPELAALLA